jgi:hypothetical protein
MSSRWISEVERSKFRHSGAWILLVFTVIGLAWWRVVCVRAGADADSDAYGHHAIARQILADPRDLGVHWVWLPLFHYMQAVFVWCGGTLDGVRYVNVVLTALVPLVLFDLVRKRLRGAGASEGRGELVALLAGLFAACCPIAMQMGTTGQPEPLFALVVLLAVDALDEARWVTAACWLTAAVLLRYEAWAVVAAVGAYFVVTGGRPRRAWWSVLAPTAAVLFWAWLRRPYDGEWFGFLKATRAFASDAMGTGRSHGLGGLAEDLGLYAARVPYRVFGVACVLAPLGVWRTVRVEGLFFALAAAAGLGFVTLTWVLRSSLGLDRHFVVLVAFYAVAMAHGVERLADLVGGLVARVAGLNRTGAALGVGMALGVVGGAREVEGLEVWMGHWQASIASAWPDRRAVGGFLRGLGSGTIFCDESTVEILSGVDRGRFDRHWLDDPSTAALVRGAALREGTVYVATWATKRRVLGSLGEVVFRTAAGEHEGLVVLRVDGAVEGGR